MSGYPITTIPESSRTILRSTTILTSLPQIIFELIQNSLDANASHIEIGVDTEQWHCWVRDDGHGMESADMSILAKGGEAGRYGTSKAYDSPSLNLVSTFGFRGEALASAADISCLEISSRTRLSSETWSVILKGGKKLYYGVAIRWKRERAGTTVCIRDAFYNLPIRRRSHPNVARTLELIRKDLECLALVCPNVSFFLQNIPQESKGSGRGRVLYIPKTTTSLSAFRHLFGRALCEHVEEIEAEQGSMKITGFISLDGAPSKSHQYLYINRHLLAPSDFHRTIDERFSASSFGKNAFDDAGMPKASLPPTRRSPRKNEKRPVYVLNISVPPQFVDNCLEPAKATMHYKDRYDICAHLISIVDSFLVKNGFTIPSNRSDRRKGTASPSSMKKQKGDETPTRPPVLSIAKDRESAKTVDPFTDSCDYIKCTNCTGQQHVVDTGTRITVQNDLRVGEDDDGCMTRPKKRAKNDLVDKSSLRKNTAPLSTTDNIPNWMQETFRDWHNPTFSREEAGIPSLSSLSSFSRQPWFQKSGDSDGCFRQQHSIFDLRLTADRRHNANDVSISFDGEHLKYAEVIAQVDKKYIACLLPKLKLGNDATVVLIDQHAADERVRVERFLAELCRGFLDDDVKTFELKPAFPVLLTRTEACVLGSSVRYQRAFSRWGFKFSELPLCELTERTQGEYVQVFMHSVPEIISRRVLQGDELRELLKGHLARLEEDSDMSYDQPKAGNEAWTTALRHCPREMLDLVNSKACRGAIMFNDSLEKEQCQRLISQLSETIWPFMCAHGRPSLVPLTDIEVGWSERTQRRIDWDRLSRNMVA